MQTRRYHPTVRAFSRKWRCVDLTGRNMLSVGASRRPSLVYKPLDGGGGGLIYLDGTCLALVRPNATPSSTGLWTEVAVRWSIWTDNAWRWCDQTLPTVLTQILRPDAPIPVQINFFFLMYLYVNNLNILKEAYYWFSDTRRVFLYT